MPTARRADHDAAHRHAAARPSSSVIAGSVRGTKTAAACILSARAERRAFVSTRPGEEGSSQRPFGMPIGGGMNWRKMSFSEERPRGDAIATDRRRLAIAGAADLVGSVLPP